MSEDSMGNEAVAVITDIHANLPALEASLARIEELGIERIYCGGDLVGYGPHPNEVCRLIEERGIPTIYGNYDYAIARDLDDCGCAYVDQHDRELGQKSVEWTLAHTDQRSKDFMHELPFDLRFDIGENSVHLVHGGVLFVNCGSVGKPKDGDPRGLRDPAPRRQASGGDDRAGALRRGYCRPRGCRRWATRG